GSPPRRVTPPVPDPRRTHPVLAALLVVLIYPNPRHAALIVRAVTRSNRAAKAPPGLSCVHGGSPCAPFMRGGISSSVVARKHWPRSSRDRNVLCFIPMCSAHETTSSNSRPFHW